MYIKLGKEILRHFWFIILDVVALEISFLTAFILRHGFVNPFSTSLYSMSCVMLLLIDLAVILCGEVYRNVFSRGYAREFKRTFLQTVAVFVLMAGYLFVIKSGNDFSRKVLVLTAVFYLDLEYIVRVCLKKAIRHRKNVNRVILATTTEYAEKAFMYLSEIEDYKINISGVILLDVDVPAEEELFGIPVVSGKDGYQQYITASWIDEIYFITEDMQKYKTERKKASTAGIIVHSYIGRDKDEPDRKQVYESKNGYTFVTTSINTISFGQYCAKRIIDIVGGILGSIAAVIIMLILWPVIYIQSPGPVIFKQQRVGKNGKRFTMYKIRSMVMNAEEMKQDLMQDNRVGDGMMFKLDYDPRIIGMKKRADGSIKKGIGNFIRDYSLDEFPQFFNVLLGQMSLVGTRPPTMDEWDKYKLQHRARLAFKPGITGLWQVSGRSDITDFDEVIKLDTQYISGWTFGLDCRILLKTVKVVFNKEGAM